MTSLSTHVLDAARGEPAVGVEVELLSSAGTAWERIGAGVTDSDGRVAGLAPTSLRPGDYRLIFGTAGYFAGVGARCFYPEVIIAFSVEEDRHYHVPLLLSPYAFSTYRGS